MYYGFNPILIIAAILPAIFLIKKVYEADRLERESPRLMKSLIIYGALSTAIAIVLEIVGGRILGMFFDEASIIYIAIENYMVVGLSEEWSKFVVLKKRTWKDPEYNCMFDGIVYAVTVSLGFALWENIKYVSVYGLTTALVRAVTAIPGHASFGVLMGIFYGMAKRAELFGKTVQKKNCLTASVLLPAIVHGTYDFLATIDQDQILFIPFIIIVFVFSSRMIKKFAKEDEYIKLGISKEKVTQNIYDAPRKDNDYTYRK